MRVVMEHERAHGRQVYDVSEKNLGYDITSLDLNSGDLRLIEVKGSATPTAACCSPRTSGAWPRTAATATGSTSSPTATRRRRLREPIRDPARLEWVEVTKVAHYRIDTTNLG